MSIARSAALWLVGSSALVATSVPAQGVEAGWYYGISGGTATAGLVSEELDGFATFVLESAGTVSGLSSTLDDGETAWSIFFGYQLSPNVAFEAGYLDLGAYPYRATASVTDDLGTVPATFGFDFETKGYPVSVVGILPIGPVFQIHGRGGIFFSDTDATVAASAGDASFRQPLTGTSSDPFYGAGVGINVGEHWSLSADWIQYPKVGNEDDTTETDIETLTLTLIYRLGPF